MAQEMTIEEFAKFNFSALSDLNKFAEGKMVFGITLSTATLLFVSENLPIEGPFSIHQMLSSSEHIAVIISMLLQVISLAIFIFPIVPFLSPRAPKSDSPFSGNPFFFADIARSDQKSYVQFLKDTYGNYDVNSLLGHLIDQTHTYGYIVDRKFRFFQLGLLSYFFSIAVAAMGYYFTGYS